MTTYKITQRSIINYLLLCLLVSLPFTLQAAASAVQSNAHEKSYDYTLLHHADQVNPIEEEAYLDIEDIPQELTSIIQAASKDHDDSAQLLAMVAEDRQNTTQYYKYLFTSNGLLAGALAQQKAHDLNYHLVKTPAGPVIWQVLSFLGQKPYLMVKEFLLPKSTKLCLPCGYMCMHLFDKKLPVHKTGCQGQPFSTTAAPASAIACFYSDRFTDQQQRLVISQVGEQAFPDPKKSIIPQPHHLHYTSPAQSIEPITTQNQLHTAVQLHFSIDTIKLLLTSPQAGINALDSSGKTPLDYATQGSDLYHLLVGHDAKNSQHLKQYQASVSPPATADTVSHHSQADQTRVLLPSGQLLIPANGHCLYTTIIMGYLLPVKEDSAKVIARIDQLFGMQPANLVNELQDILQNPTHSLTYLHSDACGRLVTDFMARMKIKKGTWGGPVEIQTIATKLKVNIQAYYPDPSDPTNLVQSDLTKPVQANSDITLYIVRDKVHPAEVLTQAEKVSAEDNPHYQHYRLKYTLPSSHANTEKNNPAHIANNQPHRLAIPNPQKAINAPHHMSKPPTIAIKPLSQFLSQMDCYPSPYELAYLSKHIYGEALKAAQTVTIPNLPHVSPTWTIVKVFISKEYSSYKAALYLCEAKAQMVLAFQGTNNIADWFNTNIPAVVLKSSIQGQQNIIIKDVEESLTIAEAKHTTLAATGHSLGGWLAQVASLFTEQYYKQKGPQKRIHLKSVTFDTPGAADILNERNYKSEGEKLDQLDITNYLSSPNLVNTCNPHIGTIYRIVFKKFIKDIVQININWDKKEDRGMFDLQFYILQSHTIDNFVKVLVPNQKEKHPFYHMYNWPVGLDEYTIFFQNAAQKNNWDHTIEDITKRFFVENKTKYAYAPFKEYKSHLRHLSKPARAFFKEVQKRTKSQQVNFFTQYIGDHIVQDKYDDNTLTTENENQDIRPLLDRLEWLVHHYKEADLEALLDDMHPDQAPTQTITPLKHTDNLPKLPHQEDAQVQGYILPRTATLTTIHCRFASQQTIITYWLRTYACLAKDNSFFYEINSCVAQYCTLYAPIQALIGYGGLGKSTLAKLYAKMYYKDTKHYQHAWWLNTEDEETLKASIHEVCAKMGIPFKDKMFPEKGMQKIAKQLTDHPHWLLVLDNANPTQAPIPIRLVLKYLPKPILHGAVIITSRDSNTAEWDLYEIFPIPLTMFSSLQAKQLLHRFHTPTRSREQQALGKLITAVKEDGLLPLTLSQIGHYIKEEVKNGILNPYTGYCKRYQSESRKIEALQNYTLKGKSDQHIFHKSIFATFNTTFDKLEDQVKHDKENSTTYKEALRIIKVIAFLHPDGLDWWFLQYLGNSSGNNFVQGCKNIRQRLSYIWDQDRLKYIQNRLSDHIKKEKAEKSVKCLRAYGILLDRGNSCATHRTIQTIMRWKLTHTHARRDSQEKKALEDTKEAALQLLETLQVHGDNDLSQQLIVEELRFTTLAHCHTLMPYLTNDQQKIRLLHVMSQADGQTYLKSQLYLSPQTRQGDNLHHQVLNFINTTHSNFSSKKKWLSQQPYTPLLLIQGDAGTGKSTYATYLVQQLWEIYLTRTLWAHIPLFISLPEFCTAGQVPPNIIELALTKNGIGRSVIKQMKDKSKSGKQPWVFIFDGYDEIHGKQNLFTHCHLEAWGIAYTKYIITCRTTYLTELGDASKKRCFHDHNNQLSEEITIAPYEKSQVEGYVDKFANSSYNLYKETWDARRYQAALKKLPQLKAWMTTPFLLVIGLEALPRIAAIQTDSDLPLSSISIYNAFVDEWLYREENKPQHKVDKKALHTFSEELGYRLWKQGTTTLSKADKTMTSFFENTYALQSAPLRYLGNNRYMFIHPDFRDFFAASFILKQKKMDDILEKQLLNSIMVIVLTSYIIDNSLQKKLWHHIHQAQENNSPTVAASNSIQVLCCIGHKDFSKNNFTSVDFRNLHLQGINLSQATLPKDLSNTKLNGAILPKDLSGMNFSNAQLPQNLSQHNLPHANLSKTDLTHVKLPKNLFGVDFTDTQLPEDLCGTNLTQAKLPQDFSNHNLIHANLTGQRFTHTNFEGTQLEGVILIDTICDYQQCFQDNVKANKLSALNWYRYNLPKDLKSIAQVYPRLSQDSHKAELLQIASGLAYLPYWESPELYIKVEYWSCKLLMLKEKLSSGFGKELGCSLGDKLEYQAKNYCWQTDYPQNQVGEAKEAPHHDFDQYLKTFQTGLQQHNCKSKDFLGGGYRFYKNNIEKNIQGLQKTYSKLTAPKLKQEAVDIAFQLSTLYQYQSLQLLLRYLSFQNRLIRLKISVERETGNEIHYNHRLKMTMKLVMAEVRTENEVDYNSCQNIASLICAEVMHGNEVYDETKQALFSVFEAWRKVRK